jgi:pilin isopeptide linkage protein/LPXTG-motif cell wall-anchored protein
MKKINLKSGAMAAVLAGTMALSMVPATAFAATVTSTDTGLTKTWEVPSSAQFTNETFTFNLAYTGATKVGSNGTATPTENREDFSSKTVTLSKDNFTGDGTTKTATKTFAGIFGDVNFSKPGVYSFTLSEVAGTNQNIVYDTNSYTVKVEVTWATNEDGTPSSETQISSVHAYGADGKKLTNGASFSNTDPNGNLTVKKTVAGIAANTDDEFAFKAELKDKKGNELTGSYNYTKTAANGTETTGTYKSGDAFNLKSGETFKITNLPEGATYTVTETNTKGYDSTDVTAEGTKTEKTTTGSGSIAKNDNDTVAFVNNKGFAPQTGITMNTLPFVVAGVVAVAGGATLVISRRKRAGEDF